MALHEVIMMTFRVGIKFLCLDVLEKYKCNLIHIKKTTGHMFNTRRDG